MQGLQGLLCFLVDAEEGKPAEEQISHAHCGAPEEAF